jgi:hypothetical protein
LPVPSVGDGAGNFITPANNFWRRLAEGKNSWITGASMRTPGIKKPFSWPTIWLAGAVVLIMAGCTNSDTGTRKAALMKASSAQEQKPIKLRYYGGPKYPMYPE